LKYKQPARHPPTCSTAVRLSMYGHQAFSVAGPIVWNSLSDFIRDLTINSDCCRRLLETYLFAWF